MNNKKLRKRDRALNVVKASAKRTYKGFQKIQPVLKKVKPIVNPRNALFEFLIMSLLSSTALAIPIQMPNPIPDLLGWTGNVMVSMLLAEFVQETTYRTSCMVPGSQWFNSRIAVPIAAIGAYTCAGEAA
jgi:hypothetical protein